MGLENFLCDRITDADTFKYTILDILHLRAKMTPNETAFIFLIDGEEKEERITYLELDQTARNLAGKLVEMGMQDERVLLLFPTGMDFIKALFGCLYAGAIAVTAYPPRKNRSLERLILVVVDSGASMVLCNNDIFKTFKRTFTDVEELKDLTWYACDEIFSSSDSQAFELPATSPSDIALLQYTSGSTSHPKGVMVTHRNIVRNSEYIRQSFELNRNSVSVTWLPSFHDMGLIDGVIQPIYTGFQGVMMHPVSFLQKPVRWLKAITKYKGTHCGCPNFAYEFCVDEVSEEEKTGIDLSSLHTLYCGAEPIFKETFEKFINAYKNYGFSGEEFYPCYGMAETTLIITGPYAHKGFNHLGISNKEYVKNIIAPVQVPGPDTKYLVGVGFPWLDTNVRIVNPETLKACGENEIGEIWVKGSIVTAGYWNNPVETERTFKAKIPGESDELYLRTGDLGFFNHGELYISGRYKDLVIINGKNIHPQDIERQVEMSHKALRASSSAAFSITIDREEKLVIVAEVERTAMHHLNAEEIFDAIRMKIAEEHEISAYCIQLLRPASILKTSSGKIQRNACKKAFLENSLEVVSKSCMGLHPADKHQDENIQDLVNLQTWLITWLHVNVNIPMDQIDLSRPISVYGLTMPQIFRLKEALRINFDLIINSQQLLENIAIIDICLNAFHQKKQK